MGRAQWEIKQATLPEKKTSELGWYQKIAILHQRTAETGSRVTFLQPSPR